MQEHEHVHAAELLRLALPQMSHHGIPVTPRNYAVWYAYLGGANAALAEELDRALNDPEPVSGDLIHELYRTHIESAHSKQAGDAREALKRILAAVSRSFDDADAEIDQFGVALGEISHRISCDSSHEELHALVQELTTETRSVQDRGAKLRERLEESRDEVEELRKELAQARRAARTDPLTSLANRAVFDERVRELARLHGERGTEFGLLFIDIDKFKNINDAHGHLVGDKVIRFVAQSMVSSTKGKDLTARYGGEEFAVLLAETDLRGSRAVAEAIRNTIEKARLVKSGTREPLGVITISLGVALYRGGESIQSLVERADQALYHSKQTGRNRVTDETQLAPAPIQKAS